MDLRDIKRKPGELQAKLQVKRIANYGRIYRRRTENAARASGESPGKSGSSGDLQVKPEGLTENPDPGADLLLFT
jgi:hypothetical protein